MTSRVIEAAAMKLAGLHEKLGSMEVVMQQEAA